jgi:M3 family oligoendopeptidase
MMYRRGLLDLAAREGKAGGGYCAVLFTHRVPVIFGSFTGTKNDVDLLTHEMGHAFQAWQSRELPCFDYLWPTLEACEIHSKTLEFLCWPQMERFFGDQAERYRVLHLIVGLVMLPYCLAVDHFQHLVYDRPKATPAERHQMWREMEQTYLPWRDHGGLEYMEKGGFWQAQLHIYMSPFYYLDYALAHICALQFLVRTEQDSAVAMNDYVQLCRRGGEAQFLELVASAGLESPFDEGCLAKVIEHARTTLAPWLEGR